jgi:hypothetical protein
MKRSRALATIAITVGVAIALQQLGRRGATPPGWTPRALAPWIERHGTAPLAVALVRLVACAVSIYVAFVSAAALAFDLLRLRPTWTLRVTPEIVRRMIGLGVAGALSVPTLAAAATTEVPVLVQVETVPTTSTASPAPTLIRVGPAPTAPTAAPPRASPTTSAAATVWQVRPGDHFWSIAERTVAGHGGDSTDDAVVARYWRVLVEANRDRLVVADDPDLIVPGQLLVMPPL